ncbi:MAG: molecular chaperone [Nitrospinota bacterium]
MPTLMKLIPVFLLALILATETGVFAASFVVSPIRVFFDKKLSKDKITIVNNGLEDVSLQISVREWDQNELAVDRYVVTKDIIFFPKLFVLKKGEQRVVRLGYRGKGDPTQEITFRLFVDEIRNKKKVAKDEKLNLLLSIGVPIFVTPNIVKKNLEIGDPLIDQNAVKVAIRNQGNVYELVKTVSIRGLDGTDILFEREKRGWYILDGKRANFSIDIKQGECKRIKKIAITVKTENDTLEREVEVEPHQCG